MSLKQLKNPGHAKISEAHIQGTCRDFLALDGWRLVITDPPWMRGLAVSEPGICDDLHIRYKHNATKVPDLYLPWAEVLWMEWKSKTGKAGEHQKAWHRAERARGALVWVAGEDFPKSIEGFQEFYSKSGLMRKKLSIGRTKEQSKPETFIPLHQRDFGTDF